MFRICLFFAGLLLSFQILADQGDIDLTFNVHTKHVNSKTYFIRGEGEIPYFENNNHVGLRFGVNDYVSAGFSYGKSSFDKDSFVGAIELTHPVTKYFKVGMMAGLASGYDKVSDNGFTFLGGPTIIARTPYIGITVGFYAMEVFVVNVDIPLSTNLR